MVSICFRNEGMILILLLIISKFGKYFYYRYINRVMISRLWRNYFPKPYFIPKTTEVSVQHFLFVDRPLSKTYGLVSNVSQDNRNFAKL